MCDCESKGSQEATEKVIKKLAEMLLWKQAEITYLRGKLPKGTATWATFMTTDELETLKIIGTAASDVAKEITDNLSTLATNETDKCSN